jgi:hypothetical protein
LSRADIAGDPAGRPQRSPNTHQSNEKLITIVGARVVVIHFNKIEKAHSFRVLKMFYEGFSFFFAGFATPFPILLE